MSTVEKSIEVNVPATTAYDQWTQFEEFPRFMEGVKSVEQTDDTHLHWKAVIAGKQKDWDAVITEQVPDVRIAWKATDGASNAGLVAFQALSENSTKVSLRMEVEPEGAIESAGAALGVLDRQVDGDLKRFKEFIEAREAPTGAWRGEVKG